jgi:hypothetical protein
VVKGRRIFVTGGPIPADELAAAKEIQQQRQDALTAAVAAMKTPKLEDDDPRPPPDADDVTKALFALRSSRADRRKEGVAQLARITPADDRRGEVHEQLAAILGDSDGFLVNDAAKAMVQWRTDDTVPALIKLLDHSQHDVRWKTAELLGGLGDARAAEPLAARLKKEGIAVEPALRTLGPAAESALIGLLRHPEWQIRVQVCRILEDVGGKEALEAMMSLPADPEFLVQAAARDTMRAIQNRVGPIAVPGKERAATGRAGKRG